MKPEITYKSCQLDGWIKIFIDNELFLETSFEIDAESEVLDYNFEPPIIFKEFQQPQ
jgi:hypothetical protein